MRSRRRARRAPEAGMADYERALTIGVAADAVFAFLADAANVAEYVGPISFVESIAVGQEWRGDVRIVLFVRLREGLSLDEPLVEGIRGVIRSNATPRHVPAKIIQVPDLPRTLNGKLVELAVRDVVHGRSVTNADALSNPESLEHFRNLEALRS